MIDYAELHEFLTANPDRAAVLEWLIEEANSYSNDKFGFRGAPGMDDDHSQQMLKTGFDKGGFWFGQVMQYADRAAIYGVGQEDSGNALRGRQAVMKMLMTLFDCAACMTRVHGLPPEPGHSSTEDAEEWMR